MFKKGHQGYKSKGTKHTKQRKRQANTALDVYKRTTKEWEKKTLRRTIDIEDANHYIYNDLPLDDLYKDIKYFAKHESGSKNENM